jgi:hypothetical protein
MSAIDRKKVVFRNEVINGRIRKTALSEIDDPDIYHVIHFTDKETLDELILNIELALSDRFDEIGDPDFTADDQIAFIEADNIEFYDQDGNNVIDYGSLQDFKELLIAWREFLHTPH